MKKLQVGETELRFLIQSLRKVDLFSSLSVGELDEILQYFRMYDYEANSYVFKKGGPGDAFYIVYQGSAVVQRKNWFFSKPQTIKQLTPGDFFGEMALLDRKPRSADVLTEGGVKLFVLLRADFDSMTSSSSNFSNEMKRLSQERKFENRRAA